jgi:predicted nicotinamide N-methyase
LRGHSACSGTRTFPIPGRSTTISRCESSAQSREGSEGGRGQAAGRRAARRAAFIRENLRLLPVPSLPEIRLYTAHPASGLHRFSRADGPEALPPYWAYPWAGGLALARHVLDHPEIAAGRRVLDLGTGSGLVAIAAAKAGAAAVSAADIDRNAVAAGRLNAAANGVAVAFSHSDLTAGPPPSADLVLAGDLYYDPSLAERVTAFLDRCLAVGIAVLIGDPWRAHLPRARLRAIAEYRVPDFGETAATRPSAVLALEPAAASRRRSSHPPK